MARRKKQHPHPNHERWLVSYADFITLMFAFFVVMFASSQTDKGTAKSVSESVKRALEDNQFAAKIAGILGGTIDNKGMGNAMMKGPGGAQKSTQQFQLPPQKFAELLPAQKFLDDKLKDDIKAGKVQVHMGSRGLVVSLSEAAFFSPGDDAVSSGARPTLDKIAKTLRELPNPVRLEGHTDSVPIHNSRFRSNWELSAARSIATLEMLTTQYEIPHERLAVAGYADTVPVATNEDAAGRARNRRVDIIILNQSGLTQEPEAVKDAKPSPFPPEPKPSNH
ncbi:MAG: OmpA family protein [Acidobacteria bacterium]|nr:OmpA family protein [Acidobacteriota bacterium]